MILNTKLLLKLKNMFVKISLFTLFYLQSSLFIIYQKIGQKIVMWFSNEINYAFFLKLLITTQLPAVVGYEYKLFKITQMIAREQKTEQRTKPTIAGEVRVSASPFFSFFNADNMEIMKQYPDKYFDLAIVDPPYGLDLANMNMGVGKSKKASKIQNRKWKPKDWDKNAPTQEYFNELFRISKNQIIWGGNYFELPPCKNYIIWDKEIPKGLSFADCEMAWTSFSNAPKMFRYSAYLDKADKFHPTQKPIDLYDWIVSKYAKPEFKIIDTHLGSGNIAHAIDKANKLDNMNLEFVGIELDTEYFNAAVNRFRLAHAQSCLSF